MGIRSVKPILLNTEMVKAILDGRKTVTRRVIKPQPSEALAYILAGSNHGKWSYSPYDKERYDDHRKANDWKYWSPPFHADDILWVRETWFYERHMEDLQEKKPDLPSGRYSARYIYRADQPDYPVNFGTCAGGWCPSIHMPREAARIWLRVTDVRVEQLQEIDEDGAIAEGCSAGRFETTGGPWGVEDDPDEWTAREDFSHVWDSAVKPADRDRYGWAANPWVWVVVFERCEKPKDAGERRRP